MRSNTTVTRELLGARGLEVWKRRTGNRDRRQYIDRHTRDVAIESYAVRKDGCADLQREDRGFERGAGAPEGASCRGGAIVVRADGCLTVHRTQRIVTRTDAQRLHGWRIASGVESGRDHWCGKATDLECQPTEPHDRGAASKRSHGQHLECSMHVPTGRGVV